MHLILDFDSTIVRVESLDELAAIALGGHPQKESILAEIRSITARGMEGEIPFEESLNRRISMLKAEKRHIAELISLLKKNMTESFVRNRDFFRKNEKCVHVFSGGFKDYIVPVLDPYGIPEHNIHANTFIFDSKRRITGFDRENTCKAGAGSGGKAGCLKALGLKGKVIVVGDGSTDYELKKAGLADKFFAFTENVRRESVVKLADGEIASFDELIRIWEQIKNEKNESAAA